MCSSDLSSLASGKKRGESRKMFHGQKHFQSAHQNRPRPGEGRHPEENVGRPDRALVGYPKHEHGCREGGRGEEGGKSII